MSDTLVQVEISMSFRSRGHGHFSSKLPQIHLPFICHLLWHLKLNLYALFRMSYLIVSIIQNCILYLTMKKESIYICCHVSKHWFSNDIFISGVWRFSVMQFQRASSKGWVPEAMNQDALDMGEVKKKKAKLLHDISLSSHNTSPFFFQSWQGFIDVFLTTVKQKYSIWKQRNMYIASNIQGIYNSFH